MAAFTDVAVFGDTNLELPSFLSNQSVVEVHMKVDLSSLLTHKRGLEILVELPLHARYPVSEKEIMKRITIVGTLFQGEITLWLEMLCTKS